MLLFRNFVWMDSESGTTLSDARMVATFGFNTNGIGLNAFAEINFFACKMQQ